MKKCKHCLNILPLDNFKIIVRNYTSICNDCRSKSIEAIELVRKAKRDAILQAREQRIELLKQKRRVTNARHKLRKLVATNYARKHDFYTILVPTTPRVEKGIPIPEKKATNWGAKKKSVHKYPFANMKVGDSFFIAIPENLKGAFVKVNNNMINTAKWYRIQVVTRVVPGGIRVWRVEDTYGD